jgi:hypothetical protein
MTEILKILMLLTAAFGLFLMALYTELGQLLNLPSDWFYAVFPSLPAISAIILVVAIVVILLARSQSLFSGLILTLYGLVTLGTLFAANIFVPDVWLRGQHHSANYQSVADVGSRLGDDADVLVLENNGDARAYPREQIMVPHIAGDNVGGEELVMTYCALSNLPLVFSSRVDGEAADLEVVGQLHNNLVMHNTETGVLYQQILGVDPVSGAGLNPFPTQRMPYGSFRKLYPEGRVFIPANNGFLLNTLDAFTEWAFGATLATHYDLNSAEPMFPTLSLEDDRLAAKERVWGVRLNDETVAFTKGFFAGNKVFNTTIGGQPVVAVWYEDYEMFGFYNRKLNGGTLTVETIDPYGNTPEGKLERLPSYPGLFWMIWSHWFPDSQVYDEPQSAV